MQYFPFLVLCQYSMKFMGSISLKMEFCLSTGRKAILCIILKVADPRNWLFLLWNAV